MSSSNPSLSQSSASVDFPFGSSDSGGALVSTLSVFVLLLLLVLVVANYICSVCFFVFFFFSPMYQNIIDLNQLLAT